jgi:hypothetical protein
MRKVIVAFNGGTFSAGAMDFVRMMNEKEPVNVTGNFLPQTDYTGLWTYSGVLGGSVYGRPVQDEYNAAVKENIALFEQYCSNNQLLYQVHTHFHDYALSSLMKQTRYADIAVLSAESLYSNMGKNEHYEYLKEVLHAAECPVVLTPDQLELPANNIIAYDGSDSSVYAMKQFCYLLPELIANPTLLVHTDEEDTVLPHAPLIKELAALHFHNISFQSLELNARDYFATWISEKQKGILISGAFSKPYFTRMFKKSFVADTLKAHLLPVFIAHR